MHFSFALLCGPWAYLQRPSAFLLSPSSSHQRHLLVLPELVGFLGNFGHLLVLAPYILGFFASGLMGFLVWDLGHRVSGSRVGRAWQEF